MAHPRLPQPADLSGESQSLISEFFNPATAPNCIRTPANLEVPTAWFGHLPFAMAVIGLTRPSNVVELGTHNGASYFAFCQAVKELRLPTRCFAVDTWKGDSQAGYYSDETFNEVKRIHDPKYAHFSTLMRMTFDQALTHFEVGSIDLLHIDGLHTYEAVTHDFETWRPKMSRRGVILFHDTEVRDRADFGVWRLWDVIKQQYPHFEFYHSHGLGVLAVGPDIPPMLRPMLNVGESEADRIRSFFVNVSDRNQDLWQVKRRTMELSQELETTRGERDQLRHQLEATRQERNQMQLHFAKRRYRIADHLSNVSRTIPLLNPSLRAAAGILATITRPFRRRLAS